MYILVKGLNGRLVFVMDDTIELTLLLDELESLLKTSMFHQHDYFPKAFFDFKSRILSEDEYYQFLHRLMKCQAVLFDGMDLPKEKKQKSVRLINRTIRAGEIVICDEDTVITGAINPGSLVCFSKHLYVLQGVKGTVQALSQEARVSSQCFDHATIRYFQSVRHNFTSLEMTIIYYKDKRICNDKGDELLCLELS